VVGALLHLVVQLPDLRLAGMVYRRVADWRDAFVREVGVLMAPRVLGLAATQINFYFIAIFFASRLDAGSISALSFAWLVVMTPLGVIGMAISTAAFPTLADQAGRDSPAMARTLSGAIRLILFLSLPAGAGLMLLAKPHVVVLLQHGAFDASSTEATAQALLFYALALFAHSGIEILSRGFYALGDTRTPVALAVASMLLNLVLAAWLVGPLELRGLALALSIATIAEMAGLLLLLEKRVPALDSLALLGGLGRMVLATCVMAGAVGGLLLALTGAGLDIEATVGALVALAASAAAGAGVYFGAALALGLTEPREVARRLPVVRSLLR
jgi:putative peptidoglycan lipid II flippase